MKRSDLVGRCLDVLLIVALVATVSQAAAQPQPPTGVDVKPPSRDVTPSDARRAVLPPKVRLAPSDATAPRAPKPGTDGHQPTTAAPKPGTDGHQPTTTGDATTPTKKTPQKPQPPSEGDDGSTTAPSKKKAPTSGSTTPTTGKKGPPKAPNQLFEALRAEWQKTIDGWKRLRQQRLAIVSSYTKPSAEEDLKKRLSARYRQLLSKRRSNRQWHVYWKDEKQFAGTLVSLLEKTRDVAPKYVAMLIKAVGAERKAYQQTIKPSLPELETADNESLKTRFTELKTAWVGDQEAVKTLTKELATLRSELAEQEKKLAAAQTPEEKKTSSDAIAVAKTAIAAKEKELDQKQKAALRGKQRTSEAEQLLAAHLRQPPDDPALRKLTQRLLQQQKEVTKRQRLLAAAVESVARAADDFLLLKEELETITAERFVALDKQLGELKKRFETRGKEVFAASKDAEKTVAELDQLIRANERNKKLMARKLGTLVAKRDPLRQEIVKLKARLTSLKADKKNKQARKDARKFEAALRKATRELRTLDVEIGAMKKAQAKLESALWLRTLWRNALQHRAKPTGAQAFDDALRRFDAAHRDANARTQQRITSGALLLEYYGSLLRVVRVTRQANERQASLKGWQELAAKKMKNQDRYLQAINISINAVDRRLKQLIDDSSGSKKKSKKLEEKRDLNPYQRYEARLDELERQRERQLANQRQAELNQKLVSGEIKSSLALRDAQRIDLRLASREAKLSEEERRRIAATPLEEKGWLEIWQRAATNAIGKKKRLSDELDKTLAALKALEVDKQYVDYQKELHGKEIARIDKEIVATRGTRTRALRDTVTNWFRQNAWDLPIGFLLAWILWQLAKTATNTLVTRAKSREKVSRATVQQVETLASIAQGLLKLAIILLTLFWFLKRLGVNVTPLLGGAAIFGLAISFGSQNLVRDVVTGFFILLEKQYAVGDVIQVGDIWGEVEQLTLRRTLIRGRDGKAHIIPNGAITQVSNLTLGWSVATVHVGVSYSAKLGHVREVVDRVGDEMYADEAWKDKFLEGPPRYVGLTEMADSALVIRVKAKTKPYQNWPIQLELNHRLKEAFDDAGIEIPFPQRDVHLIQPK